MKRGLFAALFWLFACSSLVDPSPRTKRCALDAASGVDPCPSGESCVAGFCKPPCAGDFEVCRDKLDNDCDGRIDEANSPLLETCGDQEDNDCDDAIDEGSDVDDDGFAWCGDTRSATGRLLIDCDDYNADVHPGAAEICDGSDNDCNGETDDATDGEPLCGEGEECLSRCVAPSCAVPGSSVSCAEGEVCDPDVGECVSATCGEVACPTGEFCDAVSLTCTKRNRSPGEPCASDADCNSGACIDDGALRLSSGSGRVCGKACCDDRGCGPGELCFSPGTGARSCLPTRLIQAELRQVFSCTTAEACETGDCRIGVHGGEPSTAVVSAACSASDPRRGDAGDLCDAPADCASGACLFGSVFFGAGLCTTTCGRRSDCSYLQSRVLGGAFGYAYCRTLPVRANDAERAGYVPTCVVDLAGSGGGKLGARCNAGSECEDGVCAATADGKRCAPSCCKDSDCVNGADVGRCRPLAFGDHYEMRCIL